MIRAGSSSEITGPTILREPAPKSALVVAERSLRHTEARTERHSDRTRLFVRVSNFVQTLSPRTLHLLFVKPPFQRDSAPSTSGPRRGAMNNSQRYRLNAAECLLAAKTCRGDYRGLLVSIAAFWHALARQDEAIEALLVNWERADEPAHEAGRVSAFQTTSLGPPCADYSARPASAPSTRRRHRGPRQTSRRHGQRTNSSLIRCSSVLKVR